MNTHTEGMRRARYVGTGTGFGAASGCTAIPTLHVATSLEALSPTSDLSQKLPHVGVACPLVGGPLSSLQGGGWD